MNALINDPYPLHVLPPKLRDLVRELHINTKISVELIAPVALSMASLACQNSIDVQRPNCAPTSCSIYVLVFAASGDGKSTITNLLAAAFHEFELSQANKNIERMPSFEADQLAWDIERNVLLATIKKQKKNEESVDETKLRLAHLLAAKPTQPKSLKLIYDDATPEAVVHGICEVWPSVAIISDEGGGFLNGRASQDFPTWNKIWDGRGISVDRRGTESISQAAPRCSILIAIQEAPFRRFYDRRGEEAMNSGFLPRFLVARPASVQKLIDNVQVSWPFLEQYKERVIELLSEHAGNGDGERQRRVLKFAPDAQKNWVNTYNEIEMNSAPGEYLADVKGYAAKIADNIARVSAIFYHFEGCEGEISANALESAISVCQWHMRQFKEVFAEQVPLPIEQSDALKIEKWLIEFVWYAHRLQVDKNHLRQYGPNSVRDIGRINVALDYMEANHQIWIGIDSRNAKTVHLNPEYFKTRG